MATFRGGPRNIGMLVLLMLTGAIIGTLVGEALATVFPLLKWFKFLELEPVRLNLVAFIITFGFALKVNLGGILGILLGYWMYRKS